jgi:hypothetical protein
MDLWPGREKRVLVEMTAPLAELRGPFVLTGTRRFELPAKQTKREQTLKVRQPFEPRQVSENPQVQVKQKRLELAAQE